MTTTTHAAAPEHVGTDLTRILLTLKLSGLKDTLPERLTLARQHQLSHAVP